MTVAVLGAGIVGCAAAALLAEAGEDVVVVEREAVAAGASGRNSGLLQHPLDEALAPLWVAPEGEPDGLLVLSEDREALEAECLALRARFPELGPELVEDAAAVEPALAPGLGAVRVRTGWVVEPAAVTQGWWGRARAAGARLVHGDVAPAGADAVLVCTGAWTPGVVPVWGVVADVGRRHAVHALEELGVAGIARPGAPPRVFSLVGAGAGSSFDPVEPDAPAVAAALVDRARRFVPGLGAPRAVRACPRPVSRDGRPLIGPVADGVHVCAGHGPWGVSLGPETARLAVAALLHGAPVPAAYAAARVDWPPLLRTLTSSRGAARTARP